MRNFFSVGKPPCDTLLENMDLAVSFESIQRKLYRGFVGSGQTDPQMCLYTATSSAKKGNGSQIKTLFPRPGVQTFVVFFPVQLQV